MIKNITKTILLLFIIFLSLKVEAKKMNFPLEIITGTADLIVIGEIDIVKNNSYTFKIKETLKGKKYNLISVEMFDEWTCDFRFEKAIKGQKLCLFLKKGTSKWTIINGSTGELFISGNSIYLGGDDFFKPIDPEIARKKILNNNFKDELVRNDIPLVQFKNAISDFCKCYQFVGEYGARSNASQYFIQTCSDLQVSNFKKRSLFSEWLFKKMDRYSIQKIILIDYNSIFKPFVTSQNS